MTAAPLPPLTGRRTSRSPVMRVNCSRALRQLSFEPSSTSTTGNPCARSPTATAGTACSWLYTGMTPVTESALNAARSPGLESVYGVDQILHGTHCAEIARTHPALENAGQVVDQVDGVDAVDFEVVVEARLGDDSRLLELEQLDERVADDVVNFLAGLHSASLALESPRRTVLRDRHANAVTQSAVAHPDRPRDRCRFPPAASISGGAGGSGTRADSWKASVDRN